MVSIHTNQYYDPDDKDTNCNRILQIQSNLNNKARSGESHNALQSTLQEFTRLINHMYDYTVR